MSDDSAAGQDEYHVYARHDDLFYFLAEDGCFVPDLDKACAFASWDEALRTLDDLIGDRDLRRDEPGVVANARRWLKT